MTSHWWHGKCLSRRTIHKEIKANDTTVKNGPDGKDKMELKRIRQMETVGGECPSVALMEIARAVRGNATAVAQPLNASPVLYVAK